MLISQRSLPLTYSLTAPPPPPPPGEEAVTLLLRDIRTPLLPIRSQDSGSGMNRKHFFSGTGAPSFLSAGLPRDRRGRIAEKPEKQSFLRHYGSGDTFVDGAGEETPRIGTGFSTERERDAAREKEREFLESLRYELKASHCLLSHYGC